MKLELLVDEKNIEINEFVQNILASTIIGAVSTLNGVNNDSKSIVIKIEK